MIYKGEIWSYRVKVDEYESDFMQDIKIWFRENWLGSYDDGHCCLNVYCNGEEMDWDELYRFGVYD